ANVSSDSATRFPISGSRSRISDFGFRISVFLILVSGCTWDQLDPYHFFTPPPAPPPPADKLVLRGDTLVADAPLKPGSPEADLAGAHELYRREEFDDAAKIFKHLANNTKNSTQLAEEARFFEAECYRRQSYYPKAVDSYIRLLQDFATGAYREQAMYHVFEIANFWLDDTREEMRQDRERREGKR